jgi:acyl carrier protein
MSASPLELNEFGELLRSACGIDDLLDGSTRFVDDLDFDSMAMFELVVIIEDLTACEQNELTHGYPAIETIDDAYGFYRDHFGSQNP